MKNFTALITLLLSLVSPLSAHAAILGAPYIPEIDCRFNALETGYVNNIGCPGGVGFQGGSIPISALRLGSTGLYGQFPKTYYKQDIVINGDTAGIYGVGPVIPAGTIITQAWIYVKTAVAPSGTTTALSCVTAGNILAATDESGQAAGSIFAGAETGTAGTMLYSAAGCTVALTTAVHTATAGEWTLYLETVGAP